MNQLLERLSKDFQNPEARYAYADSVVNAFVSAQIKALREARDLSQEELADLIGTKQSGVSRLERSEYSAWKIETLRKLAKAFGVRLRISFEEFGTLGSDLGAFTKSNLAPRKFENDPAFGDAGHLGHRKTRRGNRVLERKRVRRRRKVLVVEQETPKQPAARRKPPHQEEAFGTSANNNATGGPLPVPSGNQSILPVNY